MLRFYQVLVQYKPDDYQGHTHSLHSVGGSHHQFLNGHPKVHKQDRLHFHPHTKTLHIGPFKQLLGKQALKNVIYCRLKSYCLLQSHNPLKFKKILFSVSVSFCIFPCTFDLCLQVEVAAIYFLSTKIHWHHSSKNQFISRFIVEIQKYLYFSE